MNIKKVETENGWIVFITQGHEVVEVHKTGYTTSGRDDRASGVDLLRVLENDALDNNLHSQQSGKCGCKL